jgi:hypothetical protein
MRIRWSLPLTAAVFCSVLSHAQLDKIVIPAGTPEDQALTAITNEQDNTKKVAMYEEFLTKFAGNPAAVAYGNWQISQAFQNAGDMPIREQEVRRFLPQINPFGLILMHDASSHLKQVREAALKLEREGLISVVLLPTPRGLVVAQKREGRR